MLNFSPYSAGGLALAAGALIGAPIQADVQAAASQPTVSERSPTTRIAQADNCRQVTNRIAALNIRQSPGLSGDVVGVVPGGRTVNIDNRGTDGWVPISEPMAGYVSSRYLIMCADVPTAAAAAPDPIAGDGTQCRAVNVRSGLNVRAEPSRYAYRQPSLPTGTTVQLAGDETDNSTMISAPVEGYVAKRFLGPCGD